MEYFGIKTPGKKQEESYIHWISSSEHQSWRLFFQYPNEIDPVHYYRLPMEEAIHAYKAIGYGCVKLEVTEI